MSAQLIIFSNLSFYLLGFSVLLLLRNSLTEQSVSLISLLINLVGVLLSLGLMVIDDGQNFSIEWFSVGSKTFNLDILLNNLTLLMYFIVQFVSFWVQLFSVRYMKDDPGFGRYFAYINLFVLSMLGLVVSGNLLLLFVFWELVGFCSYLLIGFWYKRPAANNAAKKAFIVNRIGDVGFLIGIFFAYSFFNTLNISEITERASRIFTDYSLYTSSVGGFTKGNMLTVMGLSLFCGCIGKSAQFPLQIWLPDAMEGPTPVSALIHAATMVAAGIFLMARIDVLLTPTAGTIIAVIGVTTAVIAAFSAIYQYDIKKVLAYSTVSQLGLMVMGIGIGATNAALFHLTAHAFFKAGLFLGAGAVIYYLHHVQDIRKMGNLRHKMPIVFWCFGICAAALCGLPFFSGYLTKDALLISAFSYAAEKREGIYFAIPLGAIFASAMTAYYITRLYILVFFDRQGSTLQAIISSTSRTLNELQQRIRAVVSAEEIDSHHQSPADFIRSIGPMEAGLLVMAFGSLFLPFSANPFEVVRSSMSDAFPVELNPDYHWVGYGMLFVTFVSIWLSYTFSKEEIGQIENGVTVPENKSFISRLAEKHFYLNRFYHFLFVDSLVGRNTIGTPALPVQGLSGNLANFDKTVIDRIVNWSARSFVFISDKIRIIEKVAVDGSITLLSNSAGNLGKLTRQLQAGRVQSYVITLILGLLFLMVLLFILNL